MKKFFFKYSALAWVMLILVAVIFAVSTAINVYDAVSFAGENTVKTVIAIIVAAISLFVFAAVVAAAVYGRYVVKDNYLYCRFGFFYTKTEIAEIFQITEFKAVNKLVMYFQNEKYSVAVISEKYYREFYEALKSVNPNILYTIQSAEEK